MLRENLTPPSQEDVDLGAEPLSQEQIAESVDEILNVITGIALHDLAAQPDEWLAANDSIE